MVYDKYGNDYDRKPDLYYIGGKIMKKLKSMKKYILTLICIGVVVCGAGVAISMSLMSSRLNPTDDGDIIAETEPEIDIYVEADYVELMPLAPVPDLHIRPTTRMIYERFYQADSRLETNVVDPPYFLLGLTRDRVAT